MMLKKYSPRTKGLLSVDRLEAEADYNKLLLLKMLLVMKKQKKVVNDIVDFLKNPEKYS